MKKHMSKEQEFEIMKLVLDKFLWIGVIIMGFGFYQLITITQNDFWYGFSVLVAGAIVMFLFMWLILKEYHHMK